MPLPHPDRPPTLWKYEGAGNDFIILDERARGVKADLPDPAWARQLCERHFGVGADGLLTVLAPTQPEAQARMHITNADGSVPEMCGNGLRCVAQYLVDQGGGAQMVVETGAGLRSCSVRAEAPGRGQVTLGMGPVRLGEDAGLPADSRRVLDGRPTRMLAVSVGNPHLVLDWPGDLELAARLGPALVHAPGFPEGCNVEWVRWDGQRLHAVVFERGVGITLACGTGAVACAWAARTWGWTAGDVEVLLPGGALRIGQDERGEARLTGPARRVFRAEVESERYRLT